MRLLVTGGLGTVGEVTVREALSRGHEVTVLARRSRRNQRTARKLKRGLPERMDAGLLRFHWGDVLCSDDLDAAVRGQDAVIHMAAVLPPRCDSHPELCEAVNVGGTENLVAALRAEVVRRCRVDPAGYEAAALVYVSSVGVMGPTQSQRPPVRVEDPLRPSDAYGRSKVAAESLVRNSALPWAVLRLSGVMPTRGFYKLSLAQLMFDMSLAARCEVVVDIDAAYALVQAAESLCDDRAIAGKTMFVAGGEAKGWQMTTEDMLRHNLAAVGLSMPRGHLFRAEVDSYYLDWYDTAEGQSILNYQRHSVKDWQQLSFRRFRLLRWALRPVRGLARIFLECVARRERKRRYSGPRSG